MSGSYFEVICDASREGKWDAVSELAEKLVSFDVETFLIQPGLLAPPLVCASVARMRDGDMVVGLLSKAEARECFLELLDDPDAIITGANISYDMLVMAQDAHVHGDRGRGVDLLPKIFAMYEAGRVYDVQIAEQLHAIAQGTLGRDVNTGKRLKGGGRYSLATCVQQVLGRDDAKRYDKWRLRYAELDDLPIDLWPADAREYPLDDARNTLEVTLAQLGAVPKTAKHEWRRWSGGGAKCMHCGESSYATACRRCEPHRNLHSLPDQVYTAWALHLGAAWGFRVDQERVDALESEIIAKRSALEPALKEFGFLRADGSKDTAAVARRVAEAYGSIGICTNCEGSGRVVSASGAKRKSPCRTCGGRPVEGRPGCDVCGVRCPDCDASGLDLSSAPDLPRTETERIAAGRDVLDESGDDDLMTLAAHGRLAKGIQTYIPYLRSARRV